MKDTIKDILTIIFLTVLWFTIGNVLDYFYQNKNTEMYSQESSKIFTSIEYCGDYGEIVVDNDTDVLYYLSSEGYLTHLVDAQGNPKLYNEN